MPKKKRRRRRRRRRQLRGRRGLDGLAKPINWRSGARARHADSGEREGTGTGKERRTRRTDKRRRAGAGGRACGSEHTHMVAASVSACRVGGRRICGGHATPARETASALGPSRCCSPERRGSPVRSVGWRRQVHICSREIRINRNLVLKNS